jgi:hypothetical protein
VLHRWLSPRHYRPAALAQGGSYRLEGACAGSLLPQVGDGRRVASTASVAALSIAIGAGEKVEGTNVRWLDAVRLGRMDEGRAREGFACAD